MGNNINVMSSFLLIFVIIAVGIFASSSTLNNDNVEKYYDFADLDLLNVTGVEVVNGNDYNSLVFSSGYDSQNTSPNVIFNALFGEDLTNVSEYTIEYQLNFENIENSSFEFYSSLNKWDLINNSYNTIQTEDDNIIRLQNSGVGALPQLMGNSQLVNGRDPLIKGTMKVKLRVLLDSDYILGTFTFVSSVNETYNFEYTNVVQLSDEVTDIVDNANVNFGIGDGENTETTIVGNDTLSIDYIKLSYIK